MDELSKTAQDKIALRVKKMLALANDAGASEGERDNALRMAHATLAKHNLTMADAEASGEAAQEARGAGTIVSPDRPWARRAAGAVASLFFCNYFYNKMGRGKVQHTFIGRASNVATARSMADFVIRSITTEAYRRWQQHASPSVWWTAFCKGAAASVISRCAQLRRDAEEASKAAPTGTSLVLASVYALELAANDAFLKDSGVELVVDKSRETRPGDGYRDGRAFGDQINLNRQLPSGGSDRVRLAGKGG